MMMVVRPWLKPVSYTHLDVDGLFAAVGQQPDTALSQALGIAGEDGYIPGDKDTADGSAAVLSGGDIAVF